MPGTLFKSFKSCQTKSTAVTLQLRDDLCCGIGEGLSLLETRIDNVFPVTMKVVHIGIKKFVLVKFIKKLVH